MLENELSTVIMRHTLTYGSKNECKLKEKSVKATLTTLYWIV